MGFEGADGLEDVEVVLEEVTADEEVALVDDDDPVLEEDDDDVEDKEIVDKAALFSFSSPLIFTTTGLLPEFELEAELGETEAAAPEERVELTDNADPLDDNEFLLEEAEVVPGGVEAGESEVEDDVASDETQMTSTSIFPPSSSTSM